jgi:GDPmannose 4,6-dehydratase
MNEYHPYGIAKLAAHREAVARAERGEFVASLIMHNHESPRHSADYLVRRVTTGVVKIARGESRLLVLNDITGRRDWGWAPDFVEAMWAVLQADEPVHATIGTGEEHTVEDVLAVAFGHLGLDWERFVIYGEGVEQPPQDSRVNIETATSFTDTIIRILEHDLAD